MVRLESGEETSSEDRRRRVEQADEPILGRYSYDFVKEGQRVWNLRQ